MGFFDKRVDTMTVVRAPLSYKVELDPAEMYLVMEAIEAQEARVTSDSMPQRLRAERLFGIRKKLVSIEKGVPC